MLSVNMWDENHADIRRFANERKLKHRFLLDGSAIKSEYGGLGIPAALWINREGIVVETEIGFHGPQSLEQKTRKLVATSR